jgi:AraC family ethanolamine operon transcriptional activator
MRFCQQADQTKIADIANHWSFWRMGQFSKDYKCFFGELPSQTIRGGLLKIKT